MNLFDLYHIAEENDVDIHYLKLSTITAASMPDHIMLNPDKIETTRQLKDCLGHELGHCMTGSFYQVDNPLDIKGRHEARADRCPCQSNPKGICCYLQTAYCFWIFLLQKINSISKRRWNTPTP